MAYFQNRMILMNTPRCTSIIHGLGLGCLLALALLAFTAPLSAAILVGPTGVGPLTFDSVPPVGDFSTSTNQGDAALYFDNATMDGGVATLSAASINTPLPTSGTVNPSTSILGFRYNTALRAIQSRPTTGTAPNNCAATLLMATFRNDTGGSRPNVVLSYDFAMYDFVAAELPGFNAYFSLTGEAGSWQPIAGLTGSETVGNHVATLELGNWAAGSPLYVLWADDNANGATDASYTIDNLRITFSVEPPVINTQPVASLTVTQTQTIRLSVGASGPGIQYQWFKDGVQLDPASYPTARQATLVITNAAVADSGDYTVVVSNPADTIPSTAAHVTVLADTFGPYLISASGDPLNLTLFTVEVNEPLCTDANFPPVGCGSNATDAFGWLIAPTDGSDSLEIFRIILTGTRLEFETTAPRDPSKTYRITANPSGFDPITDLFANEIVPGSSIEVLPSTLFRQGVNSYSGTKDLELRGAAAGVSQEGAVGVTVDTDDGGGISHGLLRFDDIFGSNPGQIPLGAQVVSATLTLQHNVANANGNPVSLHRMLLPWDSATATYNGFGGGVQADGSEASFTVDAVLDSTGRTVPFTLSVSVTDAVQAWLNGQPNYGWAMIPSGTDGYRWDASESTTPPSLTVVYFVPPCSPLSITSQPSSTSLNEGAPLSLSVGVSSPGCPAQYQWRHNNTDIPGATGPVYSVPVTSMNDAGTYYVVAQNAAPSSASSASVTITIVPDTTRPVLTRAVNQNATTIVLGFSKALTAGSAQNLANYQLSPSLQVSSAVLANAGNSATVTLTTAPRAYPGSYTLRVSGLTDTRSSANRIDPDPTSVLLTAATTVESYTASTWHYATNSQDGANWTIAGFVPGAEWLTGLAFFGTEDSAALTNSLPVQPNPIATPIAPNNITASPDQFVTAYFRRQINLPSLPANTAFALCHWTDDGAIFYLDGVEIGRYNMPAGPATFVTRATAGIEASLQCLLFSAPAGVHTLAVEVHQAGTTTSDGLFGAEIRAVTLPESISIDRDASGNNTVTFIADSSWQLAGSAAVDGNYGAVPGNPLGRFVVPQAAQTNNQFFHLQYRGAP